MYSQSQTAWKGKWQRDLCSVLKDLITHLKTHQLFLYSFIVCPVTCVLGKPMLVYGKYWLEQQLMRGHPKHGFSTIIPLLVVLCHGCINSVLVCALISQRMFLLRVCNSAGSLTQQDAADRVLEAFSYPLPPFSAWSTFLWALAQVCAILHWELGHVGPAT